jgi:hypothetical protein
MKYGITLLIGLWISREFCVNIQLAVNWLKAVSNLGFCNSGEVSSGSKATNFFYHLVQRIPILHQKRQKEGKCPGPRDKWAHRPQAGRVLALKKVASQNIYTKKRVSPFEFSVALLI